MDLADYLRKFIPPLTEEQAADIAKEAEAIVKAKEATLKIPRKHP